MSKRLVIAAAAALLASVSASRASITIGGTYSATIASTNNTGYEPTINDDGGSFLSSPFSESLTVGQTTTPTTFLQVAPLSGNTGVGTVTGSIRVGFNFTGPSNSAVTGVMSSGNAATLSGGIVTVYANYELFYGTNPQTDCITWSSTTCAANDVTTTIGDTLAVSFADGAVLDVNLYNWSDWNMAPNISFDLAQGPYVPAVPEPASFAVLGTALVGLGALLWRRRQTAAGSTAA